jgi:hypothetical protein
MNINSNNTFMNNLRPSISGQKSTLRHTRSFNQAARVGSAGEHVDDKENSSQVPLGKHRKPALQTRRRAVGGKAQIDEERTCILSGKFRDNLSDLEIILVLMK